MSDNDSALERSKASSLSTALAHVFSWLAGLLAFVTPFFQFWPMEYGGLEYYLRQGPGFFGDNLLIVSALAVGGAFLGGLWWCSMVGLKGNASSALKLIAIGAFAASLTALFNADLSRSLISIALPIITIVGLVVAAWGSDRSWLKSIAVRSMRESLQKKFVWNGSYFFILFCAFMLNNVMALLVTDNTGLELTSAILGRAFFYLAVMAWLTVITYGLQKVTQSTLWFFPWCLWALIPWLVVADTWLAATIGRPLRGFMNGMTASGEFDLNRELQAGGITGISEMGVLWIFIGFIVFAASCVFGLSKISRKYSLQVTGIQVILFGVSMSTLAIAEQGIGSKWKRISAWQAEHKALMLHYGVYTPPRGVGHYMVKFYANNEAELRAQKASKKPDVYVIMVESMRADAISEKVTPFLHRFASEESQQFGTAWSGSNATHLSWYAMMHSQIPIYWKSALEAVPDKTNYQGPAALKWMKKAGYNLEVRAVCDLGYKDFGLLNFGSGTQLVDVLQQSVDGTDFAELNIPEREVVTFDRLYASLKSKPEGGNFYYTALDSPHYGYYWHNDFTPPLSEYIDSASFPVGPTEEEVQLYWNRYLNSCAWIDHQIAEFCEKLKKAGRYDNAIIVITGDHGEEFQERGRWCHCSSVFPEQTQVPLYIKWPKSVGRGPQKSVASHLDIMPSLLAYMGAPKSLTDTFAGHNLLSEDEHSVITTTSYAGTSGETMVLRRGDYAAYFSWPHYWLANIPEEMSLEFIEHKGEKVVLDTPDQYLSKLQEVFPDAFQRFIKKMEVIDL